MISLLVVLAAAFVLFRLLGGAPQLRLRGHQPTQASAAKIEELTEYASRLRATNKYNAAEKVYLQILKIDHKHTPTYSRLGTLYVAQKNYADAIECFEIATQLSPSSQTYYNLGLAYYENKNSMKTIAAFEKAVMFEPTARAFVGLAKAFSKIGDGERVVSSLEQAAALDANPKILWLLADAYEAAGRAEEIPAIHERIRAENPGDPRLKALGKPGASLAAASAQQS